MDKYVINQRLKLEAYTTLKALFLIEEEETIKGADIKAMHLLKIAEHISYLTEKRIFTADKNEKEMLNSITNEMKQILAKTIEESAVSNPFTRVAIHDIIMQYTSNAIYVEEN